VKISAAGPPLKADGLMAAKKERPKGYSDDGAKFVQDLTLKPMEGGSHWSTRRRGDGSPGFAPINTYTAIE
jgi:hypothetical protein